MPIERTQARSSESRQTSNIVTKILFWNLGKKDLREHICAAAKASSADVVVLIEWENSEIEMMKALQNGVSPDFHRPISTPSRFQLFCRSRNLDLAEIYASNRVSIRKLRSDTIELLLGLVHGVDKLNWDHENQLANMVLLMSDIRAKEAEMNHSRTILIGDFNLNPFDRAMNIATGMNAMMASTCVKKGSRKIQKVSYEFFYNPMWGHFGDRTPGPPGTFYHTSSSKGHYGWNMLDQVLFRPAATPWFVDVQILTKAGDKPLHTKSGRPDKNAASDHFPILLTLK